MNKEYNEIIKLLNTGKSGPIFFVAPNPFRAIGPEKEIKNYHIICSQNSDAVDYLKRDGAEVFCLFENGLINSGKILENKNVIEYIKNKSGNKTSNIITFKPSPKIAKICLDNGFRYLGNSWELNRKLENKVEFARITSKLNVPNAESRIIRIGENENLKFKDLFNGKKTVLQLARGFSGNSTFMVSEEKEFQEIVLKFKGREIKVSKFIEGKTYTVNAYVGSLGFNLSQPILQLTGLTSFNKNLFGTSGNDYYYASKLGKEEKEKIFDFSKKIGEYVKEIGYKGIFGLDFIVGAKGEVDLIEINPRLVGSIPVFTKLQIAKSQIPFLVLHICDYLGINIGDGIASQNYSDWTREENFKASQVILRNTADNYLEIEKAITSGTYKIEDDKLLLLDKSYCMDRQLDKGEFFIQCASSGSIINPDMEYANIQTSCGIMEESSEVKKSFQNIIDVILRRIRFRK